MAGTTIPFTPVYVAISILKLDIRSPAIARILVVAATQLARVYAYNRPLCCKAIMCQTPGFPKEDDDTKTDGQANCPYDQQDHQANGPLQVIVHDCSDECQIFAPEDASIIDGGLLYPKKL